MFEFKFKLICILLFKSNTGVRFKALARVDTNVELSYLKHGGVLKFVARSFLKSEKF